MKIIDLTPLPECPENGDTPRTAIMAVLRTPSPPTREQPVPGMDLEDMRVRMKILGLVQAEKGDTLHLEDYDHATLAAAMRVMRWPFTSENILHACDAVLKAKDVPADGEAQAKPRGGRR